MNLHKNLTLFKLNPGDSFNLYVTRWPWARRPTPGCRPRGSCRCWWRATGWTGPDSAAPACEYSSHSEYCIVKCATGVCLVCQLWYCDTVVCCIVSSTWYTNLWPLDHSSPSTYTHTHCSFSEVPLNICPLYNFKWHDNIKMYTFLPNESDSLSLVTLKERKTRTVTEPNVQRVKMIFKHLTFILMYYIYHTSIYREERQFTLLRI